ncbi:trypsin-3-like [Eleutherodactylus coqui]|uniref:trypsin-3-like n=1 Tax=Eleutherodactylus coqui TaxID=57060 RepID=UPI0034632F2B
MDEAPQRTPCPPGCNAFLVLLTDTHSSFSNRSGGDDDRIVQGFSCQKNSRPYQASLQAGGMHFCGGALIADQWVLTSAQCYQSNFQVVLGEHDITKYEGTEQVIDVYKAIKHPHFNTETLDNDIMLIKLAKRANLSPFVQTGTLPSDCRGTTSTCIVSGWGNTSPTDAYYPASTLQCLDSPIVSYVTCYFYYPGRLTDNMLCAGYVGGFTPCKGDEGGPLVCKDVLEGLVSWGNRCDVKNSPHVYTMVCNYIQWIRDTMRYN